MAAFASFGGFIAPENVPRDLMGYGAVLLALVVGVTLDGVFNVAAGRLLLWLATALVVIIYTLSFVTFRLPSTVLAVAASVLAYVLAYVRRADRRARQAP